MMSKKQSRCNEKPNKPTQKKAGKDVAALTSGTSASKPTYGRSNSLGSRGGDSAAAASKAGGSLKRGSLGPQPTGRGPGPSRPALRLCSSRSFSSLHTSSLSVAPFMRSSRSLSRLDQRSNRDDSESKVVSKQGNKVQNPERRSQDFEEQLRIKKDQMKTSSSPQPPESSSSLVSTNACPLPCDKGKKQTRDGVYTLCAMTAGMRHNWVHAVLKNVRPGLTQGATSSHLDKEHQTGDWTEASDQQQQEPESKVQPEGAQTPSLPTPTTLSDPPQSPEEAAADQRTQSSRESLDAPPCVEVSTSTETTSNGSNVQSEQQPGSTSQSQEQSVNSTTTTTTDNDDVCKKENEACEQQTGQLVKELEQTQRELSRLQQINRNLQDELQLEKEAHSHFCPQNSSEQALALKRLQKMNQDLRSELEALKASQEEAREEELRRRVDLLAQQAQLLVTGDATALAQAHLEKDRQRFQEQQVEWERCLASLKTQLNSTEEQRKDTEVHLMQLQQELEGHQQEAERLRNHLQEATAQLRANEEAQVKKDARLQKHLALLQESQERERRSLSGSLAQAERHSQELQERLDRAEQQVESLSKSQTWTREIEEAQRQLQEELARTVSAVQRLQEDREQLDRRCQELQNQLSEADREVSRLQGRLKTEETHYYNLEHSYEKVSEELQLALGKVHEREAETQEMREGYERQLDSKEQELSEVLLKMEVLGNSLEETEVKLNDVLKVCTCASTQQKSIEQTAVNETSSNATDGYHLSENVRTRSRSIDASFQGHIRAGDDPERFISLIQLLETKLYVTEEKLRDITQRLQEHQSHISCQDPHICSQLTQSRATAQHLSLLLHTQAKQSQRFALETESRSRILAGRFQVALNIVEVCRDRIHATPLNIQDLERQLATVAACLQQGEKDAEKQQHESQNISKGGGKILSDEISAMQTDDVESAEKCLRRELFVVEKMASVLQSQRGISQISSMSLEDGGDVARRYTNIISQRLALKSKGRTATEPLESVISRVCAEAELIYAALKFQQRHKSVTPGNKQEEAEDRASSMTDISPSELAYYEEQGQGDDSGSEAADKSGKKKEAEKEPDWLERLISRLQTRSKFLRQLCREISDHDNECSLDQSVENTSAVDLSSMQEQAKLIYLSDRIYLDLEEELQRKENKLQALYKEQDLSLMDEQEALNQTLCHLQEDNNALREELERAEQKVTSAETGNQRLLEEIQKVEVYHKERMQKLETEFQEKIKELQQIHEDEMRHLHGYYTKEKQTKPCREKPHFTEGGAEEEFRIQMLDAQQKGLEKLQASCDQELTSVEDMSRKRIEDLQQQHQEEVAGLLKEKEQLLQEETAATMAAIVAMRRAHKQELERSRQSQLIRESSDAAQLRIQYEISSKTLHRKEIQLLHKELEALSVQHAEKCLENSQLNQELQDERKSTLQFQKENKELKKKQRESEEMSQLCLTLNGKQSHVDAQLNSFYEMEVILRAREAEMQFLRQEARSLREELKIARMDKIYAQNKLKALYMNQEEDFTFSPWSTSRDASGQNSKDSNNVALHRKTEKSSLMRQIVRSKSLKEGLSVQERMKLFESL
ncbi:early endosome antigen 1-like [Mugil cephalus]|uniref:early endosome antigen 1-like n=1 Tax=Mugil cephalus TaxID=48193 RepID=UPI001FB61C8F|nr:early endosome antigen 1-like [Mugil cephalus]